MIVVGGHIEYNSDMTIKLFPEAIQRRRETYKECEWLSDWQVHSAHLVAGSIGSLACGFETGPIYVPMPTGSGKTVGAIWGIVDFVKNYPDQRLCFFTPYIDAVEQVYETLLSYLGEDVVGYYHSEAFVDKETELKKQVIVLTHKFIEHNQGRLDDRDLFVIDEAIYATGEATLKLNHFVEARSWATRNNVFPEAFKKLSDLAYALDKELHESKNKFVAVPYQDDLEWAKIIAYTLKLAEHSQIIDNHNLLVSVQRFCEALLEGLVFLSKGNTDRNRYDPTYSAAVLGIPRIDKTVILSATGGLVYDIAGPFQQDKGSTHYWSPPSYKQLKLVQLSGPKITGHYKTWSTSAKKEQVQSYVDWIISTVPESNLYLTLSKQVIESCLRAYFDQPNRGELEYPFTTKKHGMQINVSHHQRAVGSNAFKDCDAVIYLWDNHHPQAVAVQRFHTLANEEITQEALEEANGGYLVGDYRRIKEAQYIDNMMQQIGRGRIRNISEDAVAAPMTAYILAEIADRFVRLNNQYLDCTTDTLAYENVEVAKPVGRIARVLDHLIKQDGGEDISAKDVENAVGFELRRYKDQLINNWDIMMAGYDYVSGTRGSGKSATFKWIGK